MGARSTGRINSVAVLRTLRAPREACKRAAERGKDFCEGIAPVDTGRYKTGEPIPPGSSGGGFHVTEIETHDGFTGARLSNDTPHAWFVEDGWTTSTGKEVPGQHVMGRSIDAMRG